MKRKLLAILAGVIVIVSLAFAGWDHSQGQTRWVDRPTPASCWLRLHGDLFLSQNIQVFNDTTCTYAYPGCTSNNVVNTGYWYLDSAGDVVNYTTMTTDLCPDNENGTLAAPGSWTDCEWEIDTDGDLVAKD